MLWKTNFIQSSFIQDVPKKIVQYIKWKEEKILYINIWHKYIEEIVKIYYGFLKLVLLFWVWALRGVKSLSLHTRKDFSFGVQWQIFGVLRLHAQFRRKDTTYMLTSNVHVVQMVYPKRVSLSRHVQWVNMIMSKCRTP